MDITIVLSIVGTGITVLIVVIGAWVNIRISVAKLQVKVLELEKDINEEKSSNVREFKKIDDNFAKLFQVTTDIKVAIERKADR